MRRLASPEVLRWLDERASEGSHATGFDASGWEATLWILHAMYETEELPGGISHDDVHRMERAAGLTEPVVIGEVDLEELLSEATVAGSALGRSGWPGTGWKRLRWSELARRLDVDPFACAVPPCLRSFPYTSWPANIAPPAEGSLDREQLLRLGEHLAAVSLDGSSTGCVAFYAMLANGEVDDDAVYGVDLQELAELYDNEDLPGSPSNLWPADRSWFVYTDWDLWATKVSGSVGLISRISADAELETASLAF